MNLSPVSLSQIVEMFRVVHVWGLETNPNPGIIKWENTAGLARRALQTLAVYSESSLSRRRI